MLDGLVDPLFRLPLFTGAILALLLPLVGVYLRLREEWLAALGLAQLAGAGAMAGVAMGMPLLAGSALGAGLGAGGKSLTRGLGNDAYAAMMLMGWSVMLLLAANSHHGEELGHALSAGQLYFSGPTHAWTATGLLLACALALPWLSPRLLRARFFPDHFRANGVPEWRFHFLFDLLCAAAVAVATASIGLMATFALVFLPPWLAFRHAPSWRWTLALAAGFGLMTYATAFTLALWWDQPFGPMWVTVVLTGAGLVWGGEWGVARMVDGH